MNAEGPGLSPRTTGRSRLGWRLLLAFVLCLFAGAGFLAWSFHQELQSLKPQAQAFNCTVYYTPIEAAFIPGKGFRLDPETRTGLEGISYPADFLKAVSLEGFGRLKNPVKGKAYIYYNGHWGYAVSPMGNRSNPLQAKTSCAISTRSKRFADGDWLVLRSNHLPVKIESRPWRSDDVGPGVGGDQLDLYWGEDAPAGPGEALQRAAGIPLARATKVLVYKIPQETRCLRFWLTLQKTPFSSRVLQTLNPFLTASLKTPSPNAEKTNEQLARQE